MPSRTARSRRPPRRTSGTRAWPRVYGGDAPARRKSRAAPAALSVDQLGVAHPGPWRRAVLTRCIQRAGARSRARHERVAALDLDLAPPFAVVVVAAVLARRAPSPHPILCDHGDDGDPADRRGDLVPVQGPGGIDLAALVAHGQLRVEVRLHASEADAGRERIAPVDITEQGRTGCRLLTDRRIEHRFADGRTSTSCEPPQCGRADRPGRAVT